MDIERRVGPYQPNSCAQYLSDKRHCEPITGHRTGTDFELSRLGIGSKVCSTTLLDNALPQEPIPPGLARTQEISALGPVDCIWAGRFKKMLIGCCGHNQAQGNNHDPGSDCLHSSDGLPKEPPSVEGS